MFVFFFDFVFKRLDFRACDSIKLSHFVFVAVDLILKPVSLIVKYTSGSGLFSDELFDLISLGMIGILKRNDLTFHFAQMILVQTLDFIQLPFVHTLHIMFHINLLVLTDLLQLNQLQLQVINLPLENTDGILVVNCVFVQLDLVCLAVEAHPINQVFQLEVLLFHDLQVSCMCSLQAVDLFHVMCVQSASKIFDLFLVV